MTQTYTKWDDVREDMRALAQEALTGNPHFLNPPGIQSCLWSRGQLASGVWFQHPMTSSDLHFEVQTHRTSRVCSVVNDARVRNTPRMRYVEEAEKFVEFFTLLKDSPEREWDEICTRFEHFTVDGVGSEYFDVGLFSDGSGHFQDCINDAHRALAILEVFRDVEWTLETESQTFHYQGTRLRPHLEHKARLEDVLGVELEPFNGYQGFWGYASGGDKDRKLPRILFPFDVRCDPVILRSLQRVSGATDTALEDMERLIQAERHVRDLLSTYRRTFWEPSNRDYTKPILSNPSIWS